MEGISQKLDDLNSALASGVAAIEIGAAKGVIATWKGQLAGSDNPALAQVGSDLGGLHEALSAQPLSPATIGQHLSKVGASVQAVSSHSGAPAVLATIASKLSSEGQKLSGSSN